MVELPKSLLRGLIGKSKKPLHLAINTSGLKQWADNNKKTLAEASAKHIELLNDLIGFQLKNDIRVLSIGLEDYEPEALSALRDFFKRLFEDPKLDENQVRIFIIGQWYGIDSDLEDSFKALMEKTKNYDKFFINFCVKYDGQEEILGAIKLIVRKILSEKLKEEDLIPEIIKDNIYSSYFPPPELIIETQCRYSGLLLWDAKGALIYYTAESWLDFDKKTFDDAIIFFAKTVCTDEK